MENVYRPGLLTLWTLKLDYIAYKHLFRATQTIKPSSISQPGYECCLGNFSVLIPEYYKTHK
jgi:hypothetical protein